MIRDNIDKATTVIGKEINKFNSFASSWWDEESGEMALLHQMNPARLGFIKNHIDNNFHINSNYEDLELIDVGCGAGIITEPISRVGLNVTGIDMAPKSIEVAKERAKAQGLNINYINSSIESLDDYDSGKLYDVITMMEIIEHVENPEIFIASCLKKLKPGGLIFFSTINKTIKSYAMAILGAEYIARIVPPGTHDWQKFMTPAQITKLIETKDSAKVKAIKGMIYNPIERSWMIKDHGYMDINYIGFAKKLG